nr:Flagellar biosynthesis protein FlhB [Candidatus Pantoea persica]
MMEQVPKADVIINNPTHYSVALCWQASSMRAPVVLAKGAGEIAQRIRDKGAAHQIPMLQAAPLEFMLDQLLTFYIILALMILLVAMFTLEHARFLLLPCGGAVLNPAAPRTQYRLDPHHPDKRPHRRQRRRPRGRGVRLLSGGRQLHHRHHRLRHPDHH